MRANEYDTVSAALAQEAEGIQTAKRPGYTGGSEDVLANFKKVADRVDTVCPHCSQPHKLTAANVWAVYYLKHIDAILSIMNRPDLPVSEAPIGRFSDARNYGALGFAIVVERETEARQAVATAPPAALSDWQPATPQGAIPTGPAQIGDLDEYNLRALESALERECLEQARIRQAFAAGIAFAQGGPTNGAHGASVDSSTPAPAGDSGKVVLFPALLRDSSGPNTEQ